MSFISKSGLFSMYCFPPSSQLAIVYGLYNVLTVALCPNQSVDNVKCHLGGSGLISALPVLAFSIIPNLHT